MTNSRNLILLPILFFSSMCMSQQSQEYLLKKDDTGLRQKYLTETTTKEKLTLDNVDKLYSSDYKKIYKEEYAQIEEFWSGTRAITDPSINNYLQQIVQKIISSNVELKSMDVRVVFSRDWWPNASSMGDGSVAINAGLYIFLRNEAELVFVISHELAHYYLQHHEKAIRAYVEKINDKEYQKKLKEISKHEYTVNQQLNDFLKTIVFDSRRHGRDNESEADEYALRFMKNTKYDCNAIKTCLQTLDRIDDTTWFQKPPSIETELNFSTYPFKQSWVKKQSSIFSQVKVEDSSLSQQEKDSLKTHPDCTKRISLFEKEWKNDGENRNSFEVSETKFNELKRQLLYEMIEECYNENELSRNLYYSLALLENEPRNSYAVYSVVRCLNRLWDLQKNHNLQQSVDKENKVFPADYNLLLRMLDRLRLDEIGSLTKAFAARYTEQMKTYPEFSEELKILEKINH